MRSELGMWRIEGRLYSKMETLGLDAHCYFRSRILLLVLAAHPVHEIASDSSLPWEFGREGQLFLRLCGKTEVTWKIVSGPDRNMDMHGTICNFSHSLQLHRAIQKVQVIHAVQYKLLKYCQ